jgi:alkylated DNA repair protein (DNA oxidative demethylase)
MTADLFADVDRRQWQERLGPGSVILRGFALEAAPTLLAGISAVTAAAPFRRMQTPGGFTMSVAMSNCGDFGWVSDASGYRYAAADPQTGDPWPALPPGFRELAGEAARQAGFPDFVPDACLINRYDPGARMSLHQDKDERDLTQPIVSVSLGLPATFLFGGLRRAEPAQRLLLQHGDVLVWGGPDRLRYHGVLALKPGTHPAVGECRFNLTFRRAR